ncbi:hypothetical protein LguiB_027626 [Lonicera macranthoides]
MPTRTRDIEQLFFFLFLSQSQRTLTRLLKRLTLRIFSRPTELSSLTLTSLPHRTTPVAAAPPPFLHQHHHHRLHLKTPTLTLTPVSHSHISTHSSLKSNFIYKFTIHSSIVKMNKKKTYQRSTANLVRDRLHQEPRDIRDWSSSDSISIDHRPAALLVEELRAEHPLRDEGEDETMIALPLATQVSVIEGEIGATRGTTIFGLGRSGRKLPKERGGARVTTSESILAEKVKSQEEQLKFQDEQIKSQKEELKAAKECIRELQGQFADIHDMVRQLKETREGATGSNTSQR